MHQETQVRLPDLYARRVARDRPLIDGRNIRRLRLGRLDLLRCISNVSGARRIVGLIELTFMPLSGFEGFFCGRVDGIGFDEGGFVADLIVSAGEGRVGGEGLLVACASTLNRINQSQRVRRTLVGLRQAFEEEISELVLQSVTVR